MVNLVYQNEPEFAGTVKDGIKAEPVRRIESLTTLAQIAKAAGVSPAVVSRLLNGDKTLRISDATRGRVLGLVKEMDYTPNAAARSLRSAKSGLFALVVHDVSNPVYVEIIRGAQQAAAAHNKALLLGDASGGSASVERVVELINGGGLDGLILQAQGDAADRVLANAAKRSIPAVLMQADIDDESHLLSLPDEAAAALATEHLLELGHRAVACMCTAWGLIFSKNGKADGRRRCGDRASSATGAPGLEAADPC